MGERRRYGAARAAKIVLAALVAGIASLDAAESVARWQPYIDEAAARFALPPEWIARVMQAESGGRTKLDGRPITSPAGAMGLMQLMPATWADIRGRLGLGSDPHDPRDNILAGSLYLRLMHDRFGYPGLFGAYHAGPARYAAYLAGRRPLPDETRAYLAVVSSAAAAPTGRRVPTALPEEGIFFALGHIPAASDKDEQAPGLFVALRGTQARPRERE